MVVSPPVLWSFVKTLDSLVYPSNKMHQSFKRVTELQSTKLHFSSTKLFYLLKCNIQYNKVLVKVISEVFKQKDESIKGLFATISVDLFKGDGVEWLPWQQEGYRNCSSMMVKSLDNENQLRQLFSVANTHIFLSIAQCHSKNLK